MTEDRIVGRVTFRFPSWRVIVTGAAHLEDELRKRDATHDLVAVTQAGDAYTLFFRRRDPLLRDSSREMSHDRQPQ